MTPADSSHKWRLLLIEDNRLLREGLIGMLNDAPDLQVAAAFGSAQYIIEQILELSPDIVLLDLGIGGADGLALVRRINGQRAGVKSIVMYLLPAQTDVMGLIEAGVSGFLLKEATFEDLLRTIRLVAVGTKVLPAPLTDTLFSQIVDHAERGSRSPIDGTERLTMREREIIELIAQGRSNKEIAQLLNLATFTVKSHVHNILEKLALRTRVQVASYYARVEHHPRIAPGSESSDQRQYRRSHG